MGQRLSVIAALVLVLCIPFIVRATVGGGGGVGGGGAGRRTPEAAPADSPKLVVVTPHVEQIREEFGRAFDRWHFRTHGGHVRIDWRTPGGTADITKQLESTLEAAARNGLIDSDGHAAPGTAGCDLFFGGGTYEHDNLAKPRRAVGPDGATVSYRLSQPAEFDPDQLNLWFGENRIGVQRLFDPGQYWIGTALSGFGIVYNRDVLSRLGAPEPKAFEDLCDFRLVNMLALADGRQSGAIQTSYDSILNKQGWNNGWRTLREMCGNARYFASSSTRPPIDVSQGDAAAGLTIDFYGRSQAQCLLKPGEDPANSRVGYVDPTGAVYIDADPATILNGATNLELARRFIEFCMTEEAQALWQFPALGDRADLTPGQRSERDIGDKQVMMVVDPKFPTDAGGRLFGPDRYNLRRMPIRRVMYEKYQQFFIDKANPFEIASDVKSRGWRNLIAPLMAAFAIDTSPDLREAWQALNHARAAAKAGTFSTKVLMSMEYSFYAMPKHVMRDGSVLELNEANFKAIEKDTGKWKDLDHGKRSLIAYAQFFRGQYRSVTDMWRKNQPATSGAKK